ncbi:iron chelate uptake ABC transporter solute-binding protein, partial [Clostridium botulinum CFSAN001627]
MLKKISKQFTVLTLILLIVFSFSGCTNKTQTTSNNYRTITDQAGREVKTPEK